MEVPNIVESSSKTFEDNKKDVQVNILRGSELPKGYRIVERSPVFGAGATPTLSSIKPNLQLTAAEELIVRLIVGAHGWKEGLNPKPSLPKARPKPKDPKETGVRPTEKRDTMDNIDSASAPATKPSSTTLENQEEKMDPTPVVEESHKKAKLGEGGDSAEEGSELEMEDADGISEVSEVDPAEVAENARIRLKGKIQVLSDYQSIFENNEKGAVFDTEGATENQVDDRIQELSLILSGRVIGAMGQAGVLSEARRHQSDFTNRLEHLLFLKTRKKRSAGEDGPQEEDANMKDDQVTGPRSKIKFRFGGCR